MRDDFSEYIKRTLAQRAGHRCSNPSCQQSTSGPRTEEFLGVNIGVAAHIHAASPGGARYDELMLPEQRRDIRNGIWLCQNCAKLIDNDERRYTVEVVYRWKMEAEARANQEMERRVSAPASQSFETETSVPAGPPPVRIELNVDHSVRTPLDDLQTIVTRLAVKAAQGDPLGVEVVHFGLDDYFNKATSDPVARAIHRKPWDDLANSIARQLQLLFSIPVQEAWSYWLCSSAEYLSVAKSILERCGAGAAARGTKLDVWRTAPPELSAPVYLSTEEVDAVLSNFGFKSMKYLAFGAGWRAADELPPDVIVKKVMPRILVEVQRQKVDLTERECGVLVLPAWHIGQG